MAQMIKNLPASARDARDTGKIPWRRKWQPTLVLLSRKSHARGARWATVYGVAKSWAWLSTQKWSSLNQFWSFHGGSDGEESAMQETQEMWIRSLGRESLLEKGMVNHSSILAWRFPWTEEPGGLPRTQKNIYNIFKQVILYIFI